MWCASSPLYNFISARDIYRAGFHLDSKVRDCIQEGSWKWPEDWSSKYPMLDSIHVPDLIDDKNDMLNWRTSDGTLYPFSVHLVWESIRPRDLEVPWYDLVWFPACIPRHAVHMWLIMKRKLKTQDNLRAWDVGAGVGITCPLCETQPDSHEHLFFECPFASQVWNYIKQVAGLENSGSSLDSITAILLPISKRNSFRSVIGKISLAAVAYYVWQERNARLFKKSKRSVMEVVDCIKSSVRLKLISRRFKKSTDADHFSRLWELPLSLLK